MRKSPLHDLLASRGAVFGERAGAEIAIRFGDVDDEYRAVRDAVGITDFSFATRHRVPEAGLDALDAYALGSVAGIRFGRVLHTMAADDGGFVESDLYVANDDESFIVLGESLVDDAATARALDATGLGAAGAEDLAPSTALIGIDGVRAYAVAKALFGADVLGLPYLSIETYELDGAAVKLVRGGKTSEFGYLLLVPAGGAEAIWRRVEEAGAASGIHPVGTAAHAALRLDGRFFNVYEEGRAVRDPLALGLQWMIDFGAEAARGLEAISARRAAGLAKKIIGVVPAEAGGALEVGDAIRAGSDEVARVVAAAFSPTLGTRIGLALFDVAYAYAGLDFQGADGRGIRTVSMPPITPKSLSVKLDEM
jgi:glycine cleavage system aminomethyltransferase T